MVSQRKPWQPRLFPEGRTVSCNHFPQGLQEPKSANGSGVAVPGVAFRWSPDQTLSLSLRTLDLCPLAGLFSKLAIWLWCSTLYPDNRPSLASGATHRRKDPCHIYRSSLEMWSGRTQEFFGFFLLQKLLDQNVLTPKAGVRTETIEWSMSSHSQKQVFTQK